MKKIIIIFLLVLSIAGIIFLLAKDIDFNKVIEFKDKNNEKIVGGEKIYHEEDGIKYYNIRGKYTFTNEGSEEIFKIEAVMALIPEIEGYQKILHKSIEPAEFEEIKDEQGNIFAKFVINKLLEPGESYEFKAEYKVAINSFKNYLGNCQGEEKINTYLDSEKFIESNDTSIINTAKEITSGKANNCEKAYAIFNYMGDTMQYKKVSLDKTGGALEALNNKSGDCTYYADLFTALSRASNIPARFVDGLFYTGDEEKDDIKQKETHSWSEVYLSGTGWTPVDPTGAGSNPNAYDYFSQADGKHIIMVRGRNPEMLKDSHCFYIDYWNNGFETVETSLLDDWEIELMEE